MDPAAGGAIRKSPGKGGPHMDIKRLVLASIVLSLTVMLICCLLLYLRQSQEVVSYTATIVPFS